MNSIVCVKRVPDSEARVRVAGDGRTIDPSGVKYVMNPFDEYALEEALRQKEVAGAGTVTLLTVGSDAARETLRSGLAMGADQAVLLRTEQGTDGLGIARALADEIRDREYDLVLFGKQAIDGDGMQVPLMTAEMLGLPCATVVVDLQLAAGRGVATREIEGGHEIVEFALPAAIAAQKGLNEPRYASLKGIMAAKKKPLEEKDIQVSAPKTEILSLSEPPARPPARIVGEGSEAVPELVRLLREEARVL